MSFTPFSLAKNAKSSFSLIENFIIDERVGYTIMMLLVLMLVVKFL